MSFQPLRYTDIPSKWRDCLRLHGFSAREFASRFQINLPHFYNVLNGKSSPTLEYAEKIERLIDSMIQDRADKIASFRNSENENGDSTNETGGNPQQ